MPRNYSSEFLFLPSVFLVSWALSGCSSLIKPLNFSPDSPVSIRVATYNIKHGRGMDGVVDLERTLATLKSLNADIIALQEVDDQARRSDGVDQATWLADQLGMHAAYGAFMDFQGGRYGLAILSRRPILSHESWRLPEGNEPRVALATRIETGAEEVITAVAVHFDWVKDDGFRYAQALETLRQIQTLDTPWIIFGDFNDVPDSRTMNAFRKVAREAKKPSDSSATFPSDEPTIEIDYILCGPSSSWSPASATVIEESIASDHRPVVAELNLIQDR